MNELNEGSIRYFLYKLRHTHSIHGVFVPKFSAKKGADELFLSFVGSEVNEDIYYIRATKEEIESILPTWEYDNRTFLKKLIALGIIKKIVYQHGYFEIYGLDFHKLAVLYFNIRTTKLPPEEVFIYQPIIIRRFENVMGELGITPLVFVEIYQNTFRETPESSDIHFELSVINSDRKTARSRLVSFISQIRANYGLQLRKNVSVSTELNDIERLINNEIIELNFRDFRYYYDPMEKKGECQLRGENISLLLHEFHNKSKFSQKSPAGIAEEKEKRNSSYEKEKNAVITILYAILKGAQEKGSYHGGNVLPLEISREEFIEKLEECKLVRSKIGSADEPGKAIKHRFEDASKALEHMGADFKIGYLSDSNDHQLEIKLVYHNQKNSITSCDVK